MKKRKTQGLRQVEDEVRSNEGGIPSEFLYSVLYTLFKRKYLTLLIFFFTFVGIIFGTYLVTPVWLATARVRVQLNPKQQLNMYQGITTPGGEVAGVNPANDVIQILTSRVLAEEIVKKFNREERVKKLAESPVNTRDVIKWNVSNILIGKPIGLLQSLGILKDNPDNYFADAVSEVQDDLEKIELEEDTTIVNVGVYGESFETATDMANTLVALLLQRNMAMSKEPVALMVHSTQKQLEKAESDLRNAEDRLKRFKEKTGVVSYDDEARILIERLNQYETEVRNLESRLVSLQTEKRPDHPEVVKLEAQIKEYNNISIPSIKARLSKFPGQEVELASLNQDIKAKQDLHSMLKSKTLDLEVLKDTSLGAMDLKVIDPAKVYQYVHPDWPRWVINIPLGFIASLMTAIFFTFFIEYWDKSFKFVRELEGRIPLHILGSITYMGYFQRKRILQSLKFKASSSSEIMTVKPGSSIKRTFSKRTTGFVNPYDVIANAMFVKNELPLGKVFLFTSPGPREGKSTMLATLAQTLSQRGKKILLIDSNLRSPVMERFFSLKGEKGLYSLYEKGVSPYDVITHINSNIDIVFSGNTNEHKVDPFDLLCGERFEAFIEQMKPAYDFILLDSPAVRIYKDALAMVPMADGVILVVEANRTQERAILMVKDKIEDMGGNIKGVVLNKQINYIPQPLQAILY